MTPQQPPYAQTAPKLAQLSSDVLFGDVWERPGLSKRDRSLITVAALVTACRPQQMPFHMKRMTSPASIAALAAATSASGTRRVTMPAMSSRPVSASVTSRGMSRRICADPY